MYSKMETISKLEVYLKRVPIFDDFPAGRLVGESTPAPNWKNYQFCLEPPKRRPFFNIWYTTEPLQYFHDHQRAGTSIDTTISVAAEKGIKLPEPLIQKAHREGRFLIADEELYSILQMSPEIERALRGHYLPLLEVAKFAQGLPTYNVTIKSIDIFTPEEISDAMTHLSQFLATKYEGMVWDKKHVRTGTPIKKKRNQSIDFKSFNPKKVGWNWTNIPSH